MTSPQYSVDPRILAQAANWMMQLNDSHATEADIAACEQWKNASPEHARAWVLAESLLTKLDDVPAPIALPVLTQSEKTRRETVRRLALMLAIVPVGWLTWRFVPKPGIYYTWTAQYKTATGQRQQLRLADGSHIYLNTATAIDVAYDDHLRHIALRRGEIIIETAKDTHAVSRPFIVTTAQGRLEALGTRFHVRQDAHATHVGVFEGAVRITPNDTTGSAQILKAGEQTAFTTTTIDTPAPADTTLVAWKSGMLLVDEMRLGDVVDALSRYRPGVLSCAPDIADMAISGAYPIDNTDQALRMLTSTYPVTMTSRWRGHWVTLIPRE